jgi:uncharacterized alkaline shock family protein YloU
MTTKPETVAEPTAGTAVPPTPPPARRPAQGRGPHGAEMLTEQGRTTISDVVVAKIAGIAAREVSGVYELGGGAARAVGALRERVGRATPATGVSVEVGEKQAAVDLDIVVEYGVPIHEVADEIRANVISAIERMTSLEVKEVNVTVHDLYIEGEAPEEPAPPRVE